MVPNNSHNRQLTGAASMTVTQYLGTGTLSRGRMTITKQLNTVVSTAPYLRDSHDREAVILGINSLRAALKDVSNLAWISPRADQATEQFVDSVSGSPHKHGQSVGNMLTQGKIPATPARRCSNHWIGKSSWSLPLSHMEHNL